MTSRFQQGILTIKMAKHSPLTKEQKEKIAKYKTSPLKPSQIAKEINIPAKQIGGYLKYIRHGSAVVSKQTQAKSKQITQIIQPETKQNKHEKPVKPKEAGKMPIEQTDLEKIQGMISHATTKAVEGAVAQATKVAGETTKAVLREHDEAKKKDAEKKQRQEDDARLKTQMEDFCKKFPDLCKEVDSLKESLAKKPEQETHATTREYIECKDCGPRLLSTLAKVSKEDEGLAKKLVEAFKKGDAIGVLKEAMGEPKPKDEKSGENKDSIL